LPRTTWEPPGREAATAGERPARVRASPRNGRPRLAPSPTCRRSGRARAAPTWCWYRYCCSCIYAVYLGAAVLPLTYLPILVIANDRRYLGDRVNGRLANAVGTVYLLLVVAGALAALPLLIATKAGL